MWYKIKRKPSTKLGNQLQVKIRQVRDASKGDWGRDNKEMSGEPEWNALGTRESRVKVTVLQRSWIRWILRKTNECGHWEITRNSNREHIVVMGAEVRLKKNRLYCLGSKLKMRKSIDYSSFFFYRHWILRLAPKKGNNGKRLYF